MMKADFDSSANAIEIALAEVDESSLPATSERVHERGGAALIDGEPVSLEILYPDLGIDDPLAALAERFDLDFASLKAAALSSLAAPDRSVTLEVAP